MPFGRTGIPLLTQEKCGSVAVQKVRFGVTTALKRKDVSVEYYEHNVDNLAIEVVGQKWSSEVISFFLED